MVRREAAELAAQLREAAKRSDPIALMVIDLIKLKLDGLKESLVTADGNDMLRSQGAAQHILRLLKDLTETPPSIATPGATK